MSDLNQLLNTIVGRQQFKESLRFNEDQAAIAQENELRRLANLEALTRADIGLKGASAAAARASAGASASQSALLDANRVTEENEGRALLRAQAGQADAAATASRADAGYRDALSGEVGSRTDINRYELSSKQRGAAAKRLGTLISGLEGQAALDGGPIKFNQASHDSVVREMKAAGMEVDPLAPTAELLAQARVHLNQLDGTAVEERILAAEPGATRNDLVSEGAQARAGRMLDSNPQAGDFSLPNSGQPPAPKTRAQLGERTQAATKQVYANLTSLAQEKYDGNIGRMLREDPGARDLVLKVHQNSPAFVGVLANRPNVNSDDPQLEFKPVGKNNFVPTVVNTDGNRAPITVGGRKMGENPEDLAVAPTIYDLFESLQIQAEAGVDASEGIVQAMENQTRPVPDDDNPAYDAIRGRDQAETIALIRRQGKANKLTAEQIQGQVEDFKNGERSGTRETQAGLRATLMDDAGNALGNRSQARVADRAETATVKGEVASDFAAAASNISLRLGPDLRTKYKSLEALAPEGVGRDEVLAAHFAAAIAKPGNAGVIAEVFGFHSADPNRWTPAERAQAAEGLTLSLRDDRAARFFRDGKFNIGDISRNALIEARDEGLRPPTEKSAFGALKDKLLDSDANDAARTIVGVGPQVLNAMPQAQGLRAALEYVNRQ